MFRDRLSTTSGMGGALMLLATLAPLLLPAGGRPQTSDYVPPSLPIVPFIRTRYTGERPSTQMEQRPHQSIMYGDESYNHRIHSDQMQQSSVTNHDRQRIVHEVTRAKERKRPEEQPVWISKSEVNSAQRRDTPSRPHVNPPHTQDKRGSPRPENRGQANRGQSSHPNRPLTRIGTFEAPNDEASRPRNESVNAMPTSSGDIVFPGPTRDPTIRKVSPGSFAPPVNNMLPNCAEGSTFCESTDDYPSDYLTSVLKLEADAFKDFFGNDELSEVTQRIDLTDESPLCPSSEQVVHPKMAQNIENKWLYVVNQEPYTQGVRVEKCLKQESQCSLTEGFPLGYTTVCRQKYIYRRLLALNEDGKTHTDMFRLPSCCACFVKAIGSSTDGST